MKARKIRKEDQFLYLGRWVDKSSFRTFVYDGKGKKLANSYQEYIALIESGLWFNTEQLALDKLVGEAEEKKKAEIKKSLDEAAKSAPESMKIRKQKDGISSTDG